MSEDYAIVVGINTYPKLPPLSSAVLQDVNKFAEWLRKPDGGGITDPARLKIILSPAQQNEPSIEPLQSKIDDALESFGVDNGQIVGDRLYFYFSGHGVGIDFNDVAMLMANASKNSLNSNIGLIPYRTFFHAMDFFKEIVFIIDCCRDQVKRKTINPMPPRFTPTEIIPAPKVDDYVFLATTHGDVAFAVPDGNGLLTQALVEGLNGEAADHNGRITTLTLRRYATERVAELAKNLNVKQVPQFEKVEDRELFFCNVENRVTVKIYAEPGVTGSLSVHAADFRRIAHQADISLFDKNNPWTFEAIYSFIPYMVLDSNGAPVELNLRQIKEKNYEFKFSIPK